MKESSRVKASHVNSGTAIFRGEGNGGMRQRRLHPELEKSDATPYGGLSLAVAMVKRLGLPRLLDESVEVLQERRPYKESDHILTHTYNLFIGGSAIEDIGYLQGSEAVRRIVGARRLPDPTTAGDFLRRFDAKGLRAFEGVIDVCHELVWRKTNGGRKRAEAFVDLDSHVHPIYGSQKEGADFTYKGTYGYHPSIISLAGTQEILRLCNRFGNEASAEGVAVELEAVMPLLMRNFKQVIVRGDSAFARQEIYEVCEDFGQYFAVVSPGYRNLQRLAESLPESVFMPFLPREKMRATEKKRKRGKNLRRGTARRREMRDLKLLRQWATELPYTPDGSEEEYRLIIRRQKIEESKQGELFTFYRYRFALTNLPQSYSAEDVLRLTYQRCDQENIIEQLQHGVSAMRMPAAQFAANSAWLLCARLAFNLKAWLGQLVLPREVVRWEWKRFRLAFVYLAARVVCKARQTFVRFADSHRFAALAHAGILRLQT